MSYINKHNLIEDLLALDLETISDHNQLLVNVFKVIERQEECNTINDGPQTQWIINPDGYYPVCAHCGFEPEGRQITKFCGNCGRKTQIFNGAEFTTTCKRKIGFHHLKEEQS